VAEQKTTFETGHSESKSMANRRTWVRYPSNQVMSASITDTSATGLLGTVRDISLKGVALIVCRPFERGTNLILDLSIRAGELRRQRVLVVHAWEMNRRWLIGCEFVSPLSDEELQRFRTD
jgi:hypothetical protein